MIQIMEEGGSAGAKMDYDAMARAIWAAAPEGGDVVLSVDGTEFARTVEPAISAAQGYRQRGLR